MKKKKVLVWETLATVSGGQKMTLTVLDMLADQYEFCCLIPEEGMFSEELKMRNISYVLMGDQTLPTGVKGKQVILRYGWMSLKNIWKSIIEIRKYKPDILYAPGPAALPWSAVCGSLIHKPVVWHLHHIFLDGATKKLLNICGGWKYVREIIAVSNCVGDQIINERAHNKMKVLYNPVDVEKYANGDATNVIAEVENKLGHSIENSVSIVIGHIALVQQSKRQDFVLEVLSDLQRRGYHVIGLFAGECRDPFFLEELKKKVIDLRLSDDVLFLGRRNDIPDLLKIIDILMIPSSFEGFPLAGLEAAAAGVPVAACNLAGAEEFISVSGNGETFSENDVEEAVKAICSISEKRDEMIKSGQKFAYEMANQIYTSRILSVFQV